MTLDPDNPFAALGVPTVINAAGKMTALGGSAQHPDVAAAQAAAAGAHVDLDRLRRAAGALVAERCGAQAGCITSGAAAGICIAVAAVLTRGEADRVALVPDRLDGPRAVVLQAGHDVHFGAPVEQMIRLGGGVPRIVGTNDAVARADLEAAADPGTAAWLYVQSHHAIQERRQSLPTMIEIAHAAGQPVIVDAAAEEDPARYIAAGADLVTCSGGKAIAGPTSGFIVGRADRIEACEAQSSGIARPMKTGKEQILGLVAALARWPRPAAWPAIVTVLEAALGTLPLLVVQRVPDRAGRDIERVGVRAANGAFDPRALVRHLAEGTPSIRTRNHQLGEGLVLFDPRELRPDHVPVIADRVRAFVESIASAGNTADERPPPVS